MLENVKVNLKGNKMSRKKLSEHYLRVNNVLRIIKILTLFIIYIFT